MTAIGSQKHCLVHHDSCNFPKPKQAQEAFEDVDFERLHAMLPWHLQFGEEDRSVLRWSASCSASFVNVVRSGGFWWLKKNCKVMIATRCHRKDSNPCPSEENIFSSTFLNFININCTHNMTETRPGSPVNLLWNLVKEPISSCQRIDIFRMFIKQNSLFGWRRELQQLFNHVNWKLIVAVHRQNGPESGTKKL